MLVPLLLIATTFRSQAIETKVIDFPDAKSIVLSDTGFMAQLNDDSVYTMSLTGKREKLLDKCSYVSAGGVIVTRVGNRSSKVLLGNKSVDKNVFGEVVATSKYSVLALDTKYYYLVPDSGKIAELSSDKEGEKVVGIPKFSGDGQYCIFYMSKPRQSLSMPQLSSLNLYRGTRSTVSVPGGVGFAASDYTEDGYFVGSWTKLAQSDSYDHYVDGTVTSVGSGTFFMANKPGLILSSGELVKISIPDLEKYYSVRLVKSIEKGKFLVEASQEAGQEVSHGSEFFVLDRTSGKLDRIADYKNLILDDFDSKTSRALFRILFQGRTKWLYVKFE